MKRLWVYASLMTVLLLGCFVGLTQQSAAEEVPFESGLEYAVTYQVGNASSTTDPVTISEIAKVGSRNFLVIYRRGYQNRGYIDLEAVRAILPYKR